MTYVPSSTTIVPVNILGDIIPEPLYAHIAGGNAMLVRYAAIGERESGGLGAYINADTVFAWPNLPDSAIVDLDYVRLYADSVLLSYFDDAAVVDFTTLNQVRADTLIFKTNTFADTQYPRSAVFYDRDCAIGDVVEITSGENILRTTIIGFIGDTIASEIKAVEADAANKSDQFEDVTVTVLDSTGGDVTINVVDMSGYDEAATGWISDRYLIYVTQDGDISTALLKIRSDSGDNADNVSPAAYGNNTAIGSKGLQVQFTTTGGNFLVGQCWRVEIAQEFKAPVVESGGDYFGATDATYVITVIEGGTVSPKITTITTTGLEAEGPFNVTSGDPINIGSNGVTITFTFDAADQALCAGDVYYIVAKAAGEGAMRTLLLKDNVPDALQTNNLDLRLCIPRNDLEIAYQRIDSAPNHNYIIDEDGITIYAGMTALDSSWTDNGVMMPLDVYTAELYVEYRAWLSDCADKIYTCTSLDDLENIPGFLHPHNELKYGVYLALLGANTSPVRYTAVANPNDINAWNTTLNKLQGKTTVYGLVPLTHDADVLDIWTGHVNSESMAFVGGSRVCWVCPKIESWLPIVDESQNGGEVKATVTGTPGDYTLVTVTTDNGNFITNGVMPGDYVRLDFISDDWGENETYVSVPVKAVLSENTLRLTWSLDTPISPAKRVEVWRARTADISIDKLSEFAINVDSSRVRIVQPDTVQFDNYSCPGYMLASYLAGVRSGIMPHQGMTNRILDDVVSVEAMDTTFTIPQQQVLASNGIWVVASNDAGNVVTLHGLTSSHSADIKLTEEVLVSNIDSINRGLHTVAVAFYGTTNVSDGDVLRQLRMALTSKLAQYMLPSGTLLGGQVVEAEIIDITVDEIFVDKVIVIMTMTVATPLNRIEIQQELIIGDVA